MMDRFDWFITNPRPLSEEELVESDPVFRAVRAQRQVQKVGDLQSAAGLESMVGATRVLVWQGDITTLEIGAIVNAANTQGLGCFTAAHRCIDNVIHRAAGPRLREACRRALQGRDLAVGTEPIVTEAFFLPCDRVIHVTGPQLARGARPSRQDQQDLYQSYVAVLAAAQRHGIRSVALCCLSTGVFAFPGALAASIALTAVAHWLAEHAGTLDAVVFNTFLDADQAIYAARFPAVFVPSGNLQLARQWLTAAPAVLVVAGAGMSIFPAESDGLNVYVDPAHFARAYPDMLRRGKGYGTAYECMGLFTDPGVTPGERWGFLLRHTHNMGVRWQPHRGYAALRRLLDGKDVFVLSSNVDGCFERSGFDPEKIYTPQGSFVRMQCRTPCAPDVYPMPFDLLSRLLPDGALPPELVPTCPRCQGPMAANLRGGEFFLHAPYAEAQNRLRQWVRSHPGVTVLEIGAGFNTPVVTRFPAESIARSGGGPLIRVNPDHCAVPANLRAVSIASGWDAIDRLLDAEPSAAAAAAVNVIDSDNEAKNFNWEAIFDSLKR